MTVLPVGEPTFSEKATVISIDDESGGEYIVVRQQMDTTREMNQTDGWNLQEENGILCGIRTDVRES